MSDAPERMFVRSKPNGAMGRWHDATSDAEIAAMTSDGTNPMVAYILATPEAIAASPEVAALIAEARREERERCAAKETPRSPWPKCTECGDEARTKEESLCQECGDRAYEIWKEDEEPTHD